MPKISITVEAENVEEAQSLLSRLSAPVYAKIPLSFDTDGIPFNGAKVFNGVMVSPRKNKAKKADSVILSERGRLALSLFKSMAVCRAADFCRHFQENGYAGTSASNVLYELMEEGALVKMKRGQYRLPLASEQVSAQPV